MGVLKPERYWGFLDDEGLIHVKLYISDNHIKQLEKNPRIKGIFDPFIAYSLNDAKLICYRKYIEIKDNEKRWH